MEAQGIVNIRHSSNSYIYNYIQIDTSIAHIAHP